MPKTTTYALFFLAIFLQSGTYGLTFLLPELFADFGANEKDVGISLLTTTLVTLCAVYYSGHLSDILGRMQTLALSGFTIAAALYLYSITTAPGLTLLPASILIGFGWGLMYTLAPVVLTRTSTPQTRVQIFSLFSVFLMAGFGLAPVFAAALESLGYSIRDAFSLIAIACLISGGLFALLIKPIRAISDQSTPDTRSRLSGPAVKAILAAPSWRPILMVLLGASVFAGMNNFQTTMAAAQGQSYATFFLAYTITVVVCRLALAGFSGGTSPYRTIAALQYIMAASVILFMFISGSTTLYIASAILFGIGYGASYPILAAMAANDARTDLIPQTLQLFALVYFIGIFGFPFIAGWLIVETTIPTLLILVALLAAAEATLALLRHRKTRQPTA